MITLSRIFGAITLVALILGMISASPGASFASFVDYPSLAFVLIGTGSLLLMGCDGRDWKNAILLAIGRVDARDDAACRSAARFLAVASRGAIATGVLAYLLGLVIMLGNMDDLGAIGPGVAVALLPLLYGIGLSELACAPLLSWASKGFQAHGRTGETRGILLLSVLVVSFTLLSLFGMMLACA